MMGAQYSSHGGYVSLYGQRSQYAYGTCTTPGMVGKNPARCFALLAVSDSAPWVRPWNAPRNARNIWRFVWLFATLIAASFASVPELPKNTFFRCLPGVILPSRSARVAWIS